MGTRGRRWAIAAAIALVSAIAARWLSTTSFFNTLNLKSYDLHFYLRDLRGSERVDDIVLIGLDKDAFNKFPEPRLFWHPHYAAAIKAAAQGGAKVMGVDVSFGIPVEQWAKDNDRLLAEAVTTAAPMPVVMGYASTINGDQERMRIPVNMIAAAMGLSGFTNLTADPDDFVRSQELIEPPSADPNVPPEHSLALRVTEKFLGQEAMYDAAGKIRLGDRVIPIDKNRRIAIHYAGEPRTFPSISIVKFIEASERGDVAQLRKWVEGKIVLLGTYIKGDDTFGTPYYAFARGTDFLTAGVEIHANTIHTLLEQQYLLPVPEWGRNLALIVATIIATLISIRFSAKAAVGLLIVEAAVIAGITHWLFLVNRILSTSETLGAMVSCLVLAMAFRFSTEEERRRLFSSAVTLFVSKDVAKDLEKREIIELSGERIDVTILFTDIRGFTAYTDKLCEQPNGAEQLVKELNVYMEQMVAIIKKYNGHVNKFIGDGILAVFSDKDEGSTPGDHATRGVRCAYEMVTAENNFSTGSGLHSGPVVVGNIGSRDYKMEYTVLGDTVNLASRLESLNKECHTKLLMTGTTQALLNGAFATTFLRSYEVRGVKEPVPLYTATSLVPQETTAKA